MAYRTSYRARIRTTQKLGNGVYYTQSMDPLSYMLMEKFGKILFFPFKLTWWICKYTIGLPFVIIGKVIEKIKRGKTKRLQ